MVAPPALMTSATPVRSPFTMQPGSPHARRRLSYMPPSSSSSSSSSASSLSRVLIPEDLVDRPPLTEYVLLLLQEWLTITKLPATLRCLHDEYAKERKRAPPAMDKWFSLTQQLDLPQAQASSNNTTPLLERVVDQALVSAARNRTELLAAAATATTPGSSAVVVVASKRPLTAATTSQLKFTSKRSLPMGSNSKSTSALPPPSLLSTASRPKSAVIVPSSKSGTLAKLDERHDVLNHSSSSNNNNNTTSSPTRGSIVASPSRRGSSRPISAAPGSLTPHQDSQSGRNPISSNVRKTSSSSTSPSTTGSPRKASTRSSVSSPTGKRPSRLLSLTLSSTRQLLSRTSSNKSVSLDTTTNSDGHAAGTGDDSLLLLQQPAPLDGGDIPPQQDTDPVPAMELEDMSEERLTEQFGAFSKGTIKKLRRVLAKASAHSQELTKTRRAMDKIQLRAQQQHQRSAFAAQQTQLLSSTMDSLTKEPCSLCRFVFLKKNLATKVSYKSICDLRAAWAQNGKKKKKRERTRRGATIGDPGPGPCAAARVGAANLALVRRSARVCLLAQLVLDFASYRPSSTEKKKQQEAKRRLAVERARQQDAQRQRDKLKCDPLAFHAYELNSDDDDDHGGHSDGDGDLLAAACETEEVLEVDADGRVHVVRRRRRRRRTVRTPAQTGFVSKRLHYDHLRSQSVHALNKKEWQVISQEKPTTES